MNDTNLLDALLENSDIKVFFKDLNGKHIKISKALLADAAGCNENDIVGKTNNELYSNEISREITAHDNEIISSKETKLFTEKIEFNNCIYLNKVFKFPVFNSKNEVIGTGGIVKEPKKQ
jgi:transcriptional regulator with PAS, ATPase and Fis domain